MQVFIIFWYFSFSNRIFGPHIEYETKPESEEIILDEKMPYSNKDLKSRYPLSNFQKLVPQLSKQKKDNETEAKLKKEKKKQGKKH